MEIISFHLKAHTCVLLFWASAEEPRFSVIASSVKGLFIYGFILFADLTLCC